jgi:hypothetical protein
VTLEVTTLIEMLVTVIIVVSEISTVDVTVYGIETVLAGRVSVMTCVDQTVLAGRVSVMTCVDQRVLAGAAEDDQPSALTPARMVMPLIRMLLENLIV